MKRALALLAGMALVLASGHAFVRKSMTTADTGGSMITNEDLPTATPDRDDATFNRMPSTEDAQGSAAGGTSSGPDSWKEDSDKGKGAVDKSMEPDGKGTSSDDYGKDPYIPSY